MSIEIHKKASMGPGNMIQADSVELNNIRSFIMAENSRIGRDHHIDIADSFFLGKSSCIAGKSSQFWTHGAGMQEGIFIGENCYIGSAVRFKPGTSIGDNSIVGLGSVVTKKFNSKNVTIAGQPAKILKENYN